MWLSLVYLDLGDTGDPELGWDTFHPLPGLQDGGLDFVTISVKDLGLVVETLVTSGTVTISVLLAKMEQCAYAIFEQN